MGFMAVAIGAPVTVQAEGFRFDCSKVQANVEKLICSDSALVSLDRKLDAVYKTVLAKARAQWVLHVRQEQRGGAKGRDECRKANGQETWITARWTVNTVRGCVDAQHRLRTSEVQAVWRLLQPRTLSFACQGNLANEVVANFFDTLKLIQGGEMGTADVGSGSSSADRGRRLSGGTRWESAFRR